MTHMYPSTNTSFKCIYYRNFLLLGCNIDVIIALMLLTKYFLLFIRYLCIVCYCKEFVWEWKLFLQNFEITYRKNGWIFIIHIHKFEVYYDEIFLMKVTFTKVYIIRDNAFEILRKERKQFNIWKAEEK